MRRRRYQKIDFFKNEKDFACVYYAGIGLSYKCIEELTGFTKNQINKRLRLAGIGVRGYRTGNTPISRYVINKCHTVGDKVLMKLLK